VPLLYEPTERLVRGRRPYHTPITEMRTRKQKLSPDPFDFTSFAIGAAVGMFVIPILVPVLGYQITKRWGPPA